MRICYRFCMYFIGRDGQRFGPYAWELVQGMAMRRELLESDLIWTDPMPSWQPAGTIAGLFPSPAVVEPEKTVEPDPEPLYSPAAPLRSKANQPEFVSVVPRSRQKWMRIAAVVLVSTMIGGYMWLNTIRKATMRARDQRNEQTMRSYNDIRAMNQQIERMNSALESSNQ